MVNSERLSKAIRERRQRIKEIEERIVTQIIKNGDYDRLRKIQWDLEMEITRLQHYMRNGDIVTDTRSRVRYNRVDIPSFIIGVVFVLPAVALTFCILK